MSLLHLQRCHGHTKSKEYICPAPVWWIFRALWTGQLEGAAVIPQTKFPQGPHYRMRAVLELPPQEPHLPRSRRWIPSCNYQFLDLICTPSTLEALSPSPGPETAGCSWPWEQRHLLSGGLFMSSLGWEYISYALIHNYEPICKCRNGQFFTKLARDRKISQDFQEKITLRIDLFHNKTKILPIVCGVLCRYKVGFCHTTDGPIPHPISTPATLHTPSSPGILCLLQFVNYVNHTPTHCHHWDFAPPSPLPGIFFPSYLPPCSLLSFIQDPLKCYFLRWTFAIRQEHTLSKVSHRNWPFCSYFTNTPPH